MNYKDECYTFIKNHPGCSNFRLWQNLNAIAKDEFLQRSRFVKWLATVPFINLFTPGDDASLARMFFACDSLGREGLIRTEIREKRAYHFPTGKRPPGPKTSNNLKESFA